MPNRGSDNRNSHQLQMQTSRPVSRSLHSSYGIRAPYGQHGANGPIPYHSSQDIYSRYCQQCRKSFPTLHALVNHLQTSLERHSVDSLHPKHPFRQLGIIINSNDRGSLQEVRYHTLFCRLPY